MSAPIEGMCCAHCVYFEKMDEGSGECRRYAPHPNETAFIPKNDSVGVYKNDVHWPKVFNSSWCGQFSARKKKHRKQESRDAPTNYRPAPKPGESSAEDIEIKLESKEEEETKAQTPNPKQPES